MASSGDIEEIISKLSSDKVKTREEGIKLLSNWLEGERSFGFCKILSRNTAKLKPNEIPHSKTWPFLIRVLIGCISSEISMSKKRPPKLIFAKTLRIVTQQAEDTKFPGKMQLLLSVVKSLFSHIWDVLRDVPSYQSEYGIILRHLIAVKDYRFHMRKRVYCGLVLLYLGKVETSLDGKSNIQSNPKEEVFRCILTLHSLLENPPGDFPDNLREDIVKGFVGIFLHIRDEGKISRKLFECINTYLWKDGPNLDSEPMEIHSAVQEFVFRCWLTTHDRALKDALVLYATLQLKLIRTAADGGHLVEQLLDIVGKDLDQSNIVSSAVLWGDTCRDDKPGMLTNLRCGLLELAASLFYRACVNIGISKASNSEKRPRREDAATRLRQGLMKGKWLWKGAFCFLVQNYNSRIPKDFLIYWFEGICESFERIMNDGNEEHSYDGLLWVLRSLQELCSIRLLPIARADAAHSSSPPQNELGASWNRIWSSLIHGLPIFSNVTSVADAALTLLGNIISNELVQIPIVPHDVWDLRLFKHIPSTSALYFIACYFSRKGSQGDIRDILHLRQNLLRSVLGLLNWKESFLLNESLIMLLPAAMFSLCGGSAPFPHCYKDPFLSNSITGPSEDAEDLYKGEEHDQNLLSGPVECSVEVLAEIKPISSVELFQSESHHRVRLPRQVWIPLFQELENHILSVVMDKEIEKMLLPDLFFLSGLLCNCIHGSLLTRLIDANSSFITKICELLVRLLQHAVSVINENINSIRRHGCAGSSLILDGTGSTLVSLKSLISSPVFSSGKDQNVFADVLSGAIVHAIEKLLRAFAKLFEQFGDGSRSEYSDIATAELFSASETCPQGSYLLGGNRASIVDMELDVNEDSKDMDFTSKGIVTPLSSVKWKVDMISVMTIFFTVLPVITWEILFDLMHKENDSEVSEYILYILCKHLSGSSFAKLSDLVISVNKMIEVRVSLKLCCVHILTATHGLLGNLISSGYGGKDKKLNLLHTPGRPFEQSVESLRDVVIKIGEYDLLDWLGRAKLIDCICNFIILDPSIGQVMIEKLLTMLQDCDYRVRLFLARRIGVLFQTWDGHNELFQDVCSNFGVKLVMSSSKAPVTAAEVLAAGPHPRPAMETIVITLAHLAFHSEKIELEAIFIICVIAAIDPCQRELAFAVLDNLSSKLQYTTRSKYLDQLMGVILFSWVACRVSVAALMEIRDLFVLKSEPSYFMQYCCPWLLPALILSGDTTNLKWVAKVAGQSLAVLVKSHFVPIFGVCMALHCSKKLGREKGAVVLQSSILSIAEISELERDNLIKQHMVSIVGFILSLSSPASGPGMPFFSMDVIVKAIQTVVDGFLDMEQCPSNVGIVDKINVFRADRVFKFIVDMHYEVTAAIHHRHRCHRFSGLEALITVIGHRSAISSTSNYLFNLVGQNIGDHALQEQCCLILSMLLEAFKNNPSKDAMCVLGEQLQFLVSKLVSCCIPSENKGDLPSSPSSQVMCLLRQLIVDSNPSLYDYIRELEPFPEIDGFDEIREFHQELCKDYSTRDHFLKFVRRTSYLPQRLVLWSLQTLHKKLLMGEIIQPEKNVENAVGQYNCWHCEPELVSSVWTLIRMCGSNDAIDIRALVSDFISRVGIGDPHVVVFHLPGDSSQMSLSQPLEQGGATEVGFNSDTGLPEELLITLVRLLKKYLLDESVNIIDMTSRALRGILSTERGQRALLSLDSYERSLIMVHSKGVNMQFVEKLLSQSGKTSSAETIPLENSSLWKTLGKTYETWICPLVHSLIEHTDDMILRLCQDIVLMKDELAELLLSHVLVNLARTKGSQVDLFKLISSQVQENIFTESNELIKSVQVMLDALNETRLYYVMERGGTSSAPLKRDSPKYDKPSSYTSRSRSTSEKSKALSATSSSTPISTQTWEKVYWLSIDYLLVAKAAIHCGSYFTAVMYVEYWCEQQFNCLTLGSPDFSPIEMLSQHIEILISAVTQINEPDSLYGIVQSYKLKSQIITYEHEGNWSKALEYYDLQVRSVPAGQLEGSQRNLLQEHSHGSHQLPFPKSEADIHQKKSYKGLMRSLQQTGCTHLLELYCQGLTSQSSQFEHDSEFTELQYEAAWRTGKWDFSLLHVEVDYQATGKHNKIDHFNENLHSCLKSLQEGDSDEFYKKLIDSKQGLVLSIHHASKESTEYIYSTIVKLQILNHLGMAWDLRWNPSSHKETKLYFVKPKVLSEPTIPAMDQMELLNMDWRFILNQTQVHMTLLEPFIAFRRVLLQILNCKDSTIQHHLESASTLRKGGRFSLAAAALHEFKLLSSGTEGQNSTSDICLTGRLEEAKLLRAQGQHEMAINLAKYVLHNTREASNVYRLVGKWLAETRSSNSRTILEQYLKPAVELAEPKKSVDKKCIQRQCQTHFHLAHYSDALFRSYEERLFSNEWQAALRLRKHKTKELEVLIKRLKTSTKAKKMDLSIKIQELQKQLTMDKREAEKLQDDRDNFLTLALEGYQRCLVIGDKYDVRVVFRLVSLWFSLSSRQNVVNAMLSAVKEVQSYKFIPLVYQIASRMGSSKDGQGRHSFQYALVSLVKKMAIDHPYHTILQLLALANGDRVKDKQRSRNSFVVDMDKKLAAENLLDELSAHHGAIIRQMKQMVEIYIKLAELETKREDTNKRIPLPRDIRSLRQLELVPVVTATFQVDPSCQYHEGSFPHFKGLADSVMVMNGINAPKVVICMGSDGHKYRQLAKSGNDDLRQDAVMEQFFGLVNTFLQNHRDTWRRRIGIRTYKVVPFTPSAGVLEWVDGTIPLGEYLLGSLKNGGAHVRYGVGDWSFLRCREYMAKEKDKLKAFQTVCENFRPVMHYFFLERFLQPANWFEKRLSYTRSVAASSMVGYIVGLGDRHSMNILLDQATAEVVHIDLGVAFEQGLMLKTPEQVPFRLTRDIIDGMGVTGVEGVFRRCCEETLSVMRTNKEALLTIIEVFIHDPLYKWALSPLKALQLQKESEDDITILEHSQDVYEGNKDAARALMRVRQKLDGYEEGEMRSVHGQVQQLIQDAVDSERLCEMFPGWGAWL
ncbi:hypothetical protein MKW98_002006 [Papaver atlanticum]|uniref:Serine/threonine-protein kinase ATM n=1 Tax=Papaver atlanticum TaxID=357466 RepID=A0AAD4SPD0_9MAGN|nr:hypothetical protein MKW98_002006 [Papaver atlanticum]